MLHHLLFALGLSVALTASAQSDLPWTSLPGSPNGDVNTVLVLENGNVLVAGNFTSASGLPVTNVAIYNGQYFEQLGEGLPGTIKDGVLYEGDIVLCGTFSDGNIATWDGEDWIFDTVNPGKGSWMYTLHLHEGELHAAGGFAHFSGGTNYVARLHNGEWNTLGIFNGPVFALASYNGDLVAGGDFVDSIAWTPGVRASHIARYDGIEWSELGDGLDTTVYALQAVGGDLYAGGQLYAEGEPTFGLARFTNDAWTEIPGLHDRLTPWSEGAGEIRALAEYDGDLVFGGSFNVYNDGFIGRCIGRLLPSMDMEALGHFNSTVRTFTLDGTNLWAGGRFTHVNSETARNVVHTDLTTVGVAEAEYALVRVQPNPASDRLIMDISSGTVINSISVVDGQGRTVSLAGTRSSDNLILDVSGLASGMYTAVLVGADGTRRTARFTKD